ncbi:MAG: hypothetical protein FWC77_06985 [Defluviitaleaceae bacterium]|nr:hypothetical protein [Defluviitaleaceae bacterium]
MGLFKKKKAAIERAQIEATHEIVCLYCFRNFDHNEVVFRAAHILDKEGYRAEPDKLLDTYRARFNMKPAGEMAPVLNPDDFSEKNKGYLNGILNTLYDAHNNPTSVRLCPYCHNNIQPSAGFSPSAIISLVGAGGVGKSVYLTCLIHALKATASLDFEMFCSPVSNETARKFRAKYEDPLIENGYLPESTQKSNPQEPLIFTLSFDKGSKPDVNIAFFDVAGEGMAVSAYMDIYAAHIRNSSGVLFLMDPLQFRAISRKTQLLNNLNNEQGAVIEPMEALSSLVDNYIHKQPDGVSNIPTAAILTKTDLMVAHSHKGEYIHPRSNLYARYTHRGYFNLSQFEAVNYEVDGFLHLVDPNFRNGLKRRFAHLGLFGVSALGAQPDTVQGRVSNFAPVRVEEPFLWILYKLGYIKGGYDGAENT